MLGKIYPLLLIFIVVGCAPTTVRIPLSDSLGLKTFSNMGTIEKRNISIGLYIDPKLKELILAMEQGDVILKYYVGDNFTVKLIKALAYNVNKLKFLDQPYQSSANNLDATMIVELQDADIIVKVKDTQDGLAWKTTEAWLAVKATLNDNDTGNIVWIGTTRAESITMSMTIELTVAQLVRQITESANYAKYVRIWEGKKHD